MELPPRQLDTLQIIREFAREHGYPPTVREVAGLLGVQIHAAEGHLRALERKGVIHRSPRTARGITIP